MKKEYLGIELGSTRIKAVVIDEAGEVLASGSFVWENKPLTETVWTYDLADARKGLAVGEGGAWGIAKLAAMLCK